MSIVRLESLEAIKSGFAAGVEALLGASAPFLDLLSPLDWRVLLCGQENISAAQVISVLRFEGGSGFQMRKGGGGGG